MATYYRDPDQRDEIIQALQRLEANPGLLDRARNRYNDPPPPYSSGETTAAPSPGPRPLFEPDPRLQQKEDRWQSAPESQFHSQCSRERERLIYQLERRRDGRRQTLPYDHNIKVSNLQWGGEYSANAANNVRSRWIEQGIWNDDWGSQPGWPKVPGTAYPTPFWAHEDRPNPFVPQKLEEPQLLFNTTGDLFGNNTHADHPQSPQGIAEDQESETQRDISASRPYYQFVYQVSKECEWIRDEADYARPGEPIDVNAAAHKSIKQLWQKSKIWDPQWREMPGMKWMYEEPAEDEIDSSAGGSQPSLTSNHAQYESNSSVDNSPPVPPSNPPQYEAAMRAAPPAQPPHNRSIFDQAIRPTHSNNNSNNNLLALASAEPPVARGFFGGRAADNNDLFAPRPIEASTEQTSEAPPTGRSIPENAPEPAHDSNGVAPESIQAPTGQREGIPAEMKKQSNQVSQVPEDTIEGPKNVDDHILRRVRSSKITKPSKATGPRTTRRQQRRKQDLIKSIAIANTEGLNEFSSKQGDNADANSHAPQPPRRSSRIAAKDANANDATGSVVEAEAAKGIRQKRGANLSKPASSSRVPKSLKPQGIIKTRYQVGPKARKARQT